MNDRTITPAQAEILEAFAPGTDGDITYNISGSLLNELKLAVCNMTMATHIQWYPLHDRTIKAVCDTVDWLECCIEGLRKENQPSENRTHA